MIQTEHVHSILSPMTDLVKAVRYYWIHQQPHLVVRAAHSFLPLVADGVSYSLLSLIHGSLKVEVWYGIRLWLSATAPCRPSWRRACPPRSPRRSTCHQPQVIAYVTHPRDHQIGCCLITSIIRSASLCITPATLPHHRTCHRCPGPPP